MTPFERAQRYLDSCPPAVSGSGGHNQTFSVACYLTNGFALGEADAWALLQQYNQRCQPPWSERELRHKLDEALKCTKHEKPRGHLLGSISYRYGGQASTPKPTPKVSPSPKREARQAYDLKSATALPATLDDPARRLLLAAFEHDEGVAIAQETLGDDGRGIPKDSGATMLRDEWLRKLDKAAGDPNKIYSSTDKTGAFIRVNPLRPGGSKDADVTAFRHVLLEFDKITVEEQWALIQQSNIPCTAVLHSGNRSLHAWVRVDAQSRAEYDERVKYLFDHFCDYRPDEKNKNPSRFSRLPGMVRGDRRQELIAVAQDGKLIGAESWQDWTQTEGEGLPRILNVGAQIRRIRNKDLVCPDEIVAGILHRGHKLVLGGGSKTNKTWCLIDLAISVATGSSWLGYQTLAGNVLYLNFEVDEYHFHKRIEWVADAKSIPIDALESGGFDSWCLRGHTSPYDEMIPAILRFTKNRQYDLIVLDPLYKLFGSADENKATDITQLLNSIEELALHTGAATAFGAHFSKGNQAGKEAIDRISGSGVFARDPDTIMLLTRHEDDDCFVVDFTLRNFRSVKPFVVRWDFPMLRVDGGLDPKRLKRVENTAVYTVAQILECLTEPMQNCDLLDAVKAKHGIADSTFHRLLKKAVKAGDVVRFDGEDKVMRYRRGK